ncbi:hypothetical protein [Rubellimicrobium aerolatum]|uniref:Uncharacterized protein n=1 Tax=Rubellimicrobium aerolatum TaxID=490979 RepID=A0ABW0SG49_9RHOB|nr:hypothetical protein [Rubellimicrobium aerolatum]MBP1807283.1 hypothetical protein [Rubellimicrobium aerolatum]
MTRLDELDTLHRQGSAYALIAARTGFSGTARALEAMLRAIEAERALILSQDALADGSAQEPARPKAGHATA